MNPDVEKIKIDDQIAEHCFANFSVFNTGPEEICIGFGVRDLQDPYKVNLFHYYHLTIPHFLRFAQLVNQQMELLEEKGVISRTLPQ